MTLYALDTNIISYLLRNKHGIAEKISIEMNNGNQITIPPIAYYEVMRGLLLIDAPRKCAIFEDLCANLGVGAINRETMDVAAREHARLRKMGTPVDDADLLIAAYCMQAGATLVTNNTKHFENIKNLQYTNWV